MTLQKVIHEGNVSEYQSSDCEPLSKTSKSAGTWYQNTSGSALVVMLSIGAASNPVSAGIHVNSTESDRKIMNIEEAEYGSTHVTFIVPNGHYYKVTNEMLVSVAYEFNITAWVETSLI